MVRILANGEIVQDDDPRVRNNSTSRRNTYQGGDASSSRYFQPQQNNNVDVAQGPTIFDTWNQKLLQLGIPRWNIGNHVVEPLMTVMALIVLLFVGVHGLLFLGLLYFVVKISQRSSQPTASGNSFGQGRRNSDFGGGGGRRLGR